MSTNKPRSELIELITGNLGVFQQPEHIEALFITTVDDLQRGGVDARRVLASMIMAWARLVDGEIGRPKMIKVLRDIADRFERDPQQTVSIN